MKRWRALFCAVLLCGLCWTGLSMPVSAVSIRDQDSFDKWVQYSWYNGSSWVVLNPFHVQDSLRTSINFPSGAKYTGRFDVLIPFSTSFVSSLTFQAPYFTIDGGVSRASWLYDWTNSCDLSAVNITFDDSGVPSRTHLAYFNRNSEYFDSASGVWSIPVSALPEGTNGLYFYFNFAEPRTRGTVYDIYVNDGTILKVNYDSNVGSVSGSLVFGSAHVLDDFASFVLEVGELSDPAASFSYGYKLYSGGKELRSVFDDGTVTGSDNYLIHSTIRNLDPETDYEVVYTMYANGEPTEITASTSFTTLASSSSGGGSDPDYSGQLNGIQQGIGNIQNSVDNVGSKVDIVQNTLTETKQEITSLPGKIASAIIDGIKSLFVPSEEDLTEIKGKYENMLSEKLGFVWQGFDLLTTFVGDLQTSLESGEAYGFNFPGVKLPMQGEEFVLVPETAVSLDNGLMDVLRPVLGTVISMIAVIAFVNMAHDYVLAIISGVSAYQFERRKE